MLQSMKQSGGNWSGRLVVITIFSLALIMGFTAMKLRKKMPTLPTTIPTTGTATSPSY